MVAVTQRIPNFLGGVSQQVDERLFPGQVRNALNAYPDPTFGLTKRPGGKFIKELRAANGQIIAPGTFDNGAWFSIFRDGSEKYVAVINNGTLSIWSLIDGSRKTVTMTGSASTYLTGSKNDFNFLTVNDYTFITNKNVVVRPLPATSYTPGKTATVRLTAVAYSSEYVVTINGVDYKYLTINADSNVGATDPAKKVLNADDILTGLKNAITAPGVTVTKYKTSLELSSSSVMTVTAKGGQNSEALRAYQDVATSSGGTATGTTSVTNISQLSEETANGRTVEITNSAANASSYYVKFVASNGTGGTGYWEETIKPGLSTGLDPATMPHELVRNANGTFTVQPVSWEPRLVGDDDSNSHPSFVNSTIQQLFFYNNRLGFLTEDNVSLSQAGEYFNFYHTTATTVTAADPIDLSCSSVKPAALHAVIPTAQGLLLFSQYQQFMMSSDSGVWTPLTVLIKSISNYECDPLVLPVDLGTTSVFTSKNPNYTRVFEMTTRGQNENPVVVDQSKIVSEWIPSARNQLVASPQNSLVTLAGSDSDTLYMYRFYDAGEERKMAAWVNWQLSGKIQHHAINSDIMFAVTLQSGSYVIQQIQLVQSPVTSALVSSTGTKVDPCLDLWSLVTGTYNSTSRTTKYYVPFPYDTGRDLCITGGVPSNTAFFESGFVNFPQVQNDATGYYVEIPGNFTQSNMFIGYTYNYEVTLPRYYYSTQTGNDFTASIVMSRYRIYVGQGSNLDFSIKANGRPEWKEIAGSIKADFYKADDTPMDPYHIYTIPIMQRSENFTLRLTSNLPFPVNLVSMVWEGQYSNRFYRRA
jgi:hypothetical protein